MKVGWIFSSIIFLLIFNLLSENEIAIVNGLIVENNPFYGLSSEKIKTVESTTDDKLIKIKLEYAPQAIEIGSPRIFLK
jgi:hypothetical protein